MTARQQAIADIKDDLQSVNKSKGTSKSFIAFKKSLDPVMNTLVHGMLWKQQSISSKFNRPRNAQRICRATPNASVCFFSFSNRKETV